MNLDFLLAPQSVLTNLAVSEIVDCNKLSSRYGLILSSQEAQELVETRTAALQATGRLEFGSGIIAKIVTAFCSSPYITSKDYATTLHELVETFYYYKNETLDELSDDELIALMRRYFDQTCHGSLELLQNREMYQVARNIRFGLTNCLSQDENENSTGEDDYDE